MGIEDDNVIKGPWKKKEPEGQTIRDLYLGKEERPFDFSGMKEYLEAAEKRANKIISATNDCDLTRAEKLRDNYVQENPGKALSLAAIVMGASDKDIEFDPEGHRAAALAFLQINNPPEDI